MSSSASEPAGDNPIVLSIRHRISRALVGMAVGLVVLVTASFVCGIVMGVVDRIGASDKPDLISYGMSAIAFALLILGIPLGIVSAIAAWRTQRT